MSNLVLKSLDVDVINFLLHNNNATIDELSNCFDVSSVNIRHVLSKIENFTAANNLGKLIKNEGQYFFESNNIELNFDHKKFEVKDIEKKERIVYILLKFILEKSLNLTAISKKLKVSRITLNGDLELIKEMLEDFNLSLTSIQWKGIFIENNLPDIQRFTIFFIVKLYIEGYFFSPLKKIINPLVFNYYRKIISRENEKKIFSIANKLYQHFDLNHGRHHYYILIGILVYMHLSTLNKNIELNCNLENQQDDFKIVLDSLLNDEDRKIIGEKFALLNFYFSNCISKKYPIPVSENINTALKEFCSIYDLKNNNISLEIFSFFVHNIYFENRFFVPTYIKFTKEDTIKLETEICKNLIDIFERNNIPFSKKDIIFLHDYILARSEENRKKSVLIVDGNAMNYPGEILKSKLMYDEKIGAVTIASYFDFNSFPEKYRNYDIFFFIDSALEKKCNYFNKICFFVTGHEILKNNVNFKELAY